MPQQIANFKAEFFRALAHPVRIRILDCLRNGEKGVNELSEMLQIEQANVSQHLAVLRAKQLVSNRKAGNQVFYSVRDPIIIEVLSLMRTYFQVHLKEALGMLDEMEKPLETV